MNNENRWISMKQPKQTDINETIKQTDISVTIKQTDIKKQQNKQV